MALNGARATDTETSFTDWLVRVKWFIVAAAVVLGCALVYAGSRFDGASDYWGSVLLEIGAALVIVAPLVGLEHLIEKRIAQAAETVRSEVEDVRRGVNAAHTRLGELGQKTESLIAATRLADEDAVRAMRENISEANTWWPLHRAHDLGAIDQRGVRVRLAGSQLWVRFSAASADAPEGANPVTVIVEGRGGDLVASEEWSPDEAPHQAFARLATELQRVGSYPGDDTFDADSIFVYLADTVEVALKLRTEGRAGSPLGPIVELVGDWAVTTNGLEHLHDPTRAVRVKDMRDDPETVRSRLLASASSDAVVATIDEALSTAIEYHSGEARRAAQERVPKG
jgi:hypothetical protein